MNFVLENKLSSEIKLDGRTYDDKSGLEKLCCLHVSIDMNSIYETGKDMLCF